MIALTDQPFEPGELLSAFAKARSETGAIATFTGRSRRLAAIAAATLSGAMPSFEPKPPPT